MKIKIYKNETKDLKRLVRLADSLQNGYHALQYNDYSDPHYGSKIIKVMKYNQDEVQEIYKRHPRLSEVMVVILKHDDVELEFKRNELQKGVAVPSKEKGSGRDRQGNLQQGEAPQELQPKTLGEQVVEG